MSRVDQQPLLIDNFESSSSTSSILILDEEHSRKSCCSWIYFDGVKEARSVAMIYIARGSIIVSALFMGSSLISLANTAAGCDDEIENEDNLHPCSKKIFGFKPSSLITMISFMSGILTAFMMPIIGSILEYTSLRKSMGILSAFLLWMMQSAEIMTNHSTWLLMALLQSLSGFLYNSQVLIITSYLPHIGRTVGEERMTNYVAIFNSILFSSCMLFLFTVNAIVAEADISDADTARYSQTINCLILPPLFALAWKNLPFVSAQHVLEPDQCLLGAGFSQTWQTAKDINEKYADGIKFFYLATVFAEAGMSAFSSISLVYMIETLGASSFEIGVIFSLVFLSIIPGSFLGALFTKKSNPIISWKTSLIIFSAFTAIGAYVLDRPERIQYAYIWAILWGVIMGWFYSIEELIFSLSLPNAEETGLTGFYVYCRTILSWLPPLVFTYLNEAGVPMQWGLLSLVFFFLIALVFLHFMAPWEKVLDVARSSTVMP